MPDVLLCGACLVLPLKAAVRDVLDCPSSNFDLNGLKAACGLLRNLAIPAQARSTYFSSPRVDACLDVWLLVWTFGGLGASVCCACAPFQRRHGCVHVYVVGHIARPLWALFCG